ncbi:MAG: hypothetical protein NVS1B3_05510 [Candidatus Dormibacteraceae bacterium]
MNTRHDPELDDILQDEELLRLGELLSARQRPEPPLDDAFRSGLRRQLMQQAWEMSEGKPSLWKRAFAPPGMAWIGATAGLLLIASIVVFNSIQQPASTDISFKSQMDGSTSVALAQPILVKFNQPMDHLSTEAAVQIAPATNVTFSWETNTLAVQPTTGNLAPNTQYQVTIGPGATTASGQHLPTAQTITFVTQPPAPPPTPSPSPTPRASSSPTSLLTDERQLVALGGGTRAPLQWSADSSTIYFVDSNGALEAVPVKGGDVKVVAAGGVTSPAISPAGDRLAYIRGGKIQVLTFAAGTTAEVLVTPAPTMVGWAKDKLLWAAADGLYAQGTNKSEQLAPLPTNGTVTVQSISPDGGHAVYRQDQKLALLDITTSKTMPLGQANAEFYGWSPSGAQLLYSSDQGLVVSDLLGNSAGTLSGGAASWSSQDAILVGGDSDLYQARPDGSSLTKLANGTYHFPIWAPNGTAFVFFRGGARWAASAPALPPLPNVIDQAAAVVNSFMQARLKGLADQATTYLDANGKQAYSTGGLKLVITSDDPRFSRFYVLTQQVTGTKPDIATFVVRLVLTHGKLDIANFEETLTVVRDATTKLFVIDQATTGAQRDLGKGAEVVAIVVTTGSLQVTFDSDLDPGTVPDGVHLLDAKGKQVESTATYANRTVTVSGLDLKPGARYRLVVLPTMRDVLGHNMASEYDLQLVGPAVYDHPEHRGPGIAPASPSPVSTPTPTPTR